MLKNSENNGTEKIGLVTPTPGTLSFGRETSKTRIDSRHVLKYDYGNPYVCHNHEMSSSWSTFCFDKNYAKSKLAILTSAKL